MTLPLDKFGIDHWSTFAYIETCCVDYQGKVDPRRMRSEGGKYPSRLKDGETLEGHSDWDCMLDLKAAGLLKQIGTQVFKLTRKGWSVASKLRQHRALHGTFGGFGE